MSARPAGTRRAVVIGAVMVVAVVVAARALDLRPLLETALERIQHLGAWGPVTFVALYVAATVLFVPGSLLTVGAGATFGFATGVVTVWIAATLGATAAFLVGRHLARDAIARRLADDPRFRAIDEAVARDGWKIVGLVRLSPVFPFSLLNYAFGISRVSTREYVAASAIAMLPGTIMYVYLGSVAGSLAALGAGRHARTPAEWAFSGVGLLATVAVTIYITRLARGALARRGAA
jgi:uncharacterized membrane protein YdjX (TVP38/TMEM64 family)